MKNSIPVTLKIEKVRKHQSDFSELEAKELPIEYYPKQPLDADILYKEIDEFIKKYSIKDFVEVLYNVLKDQNEAKKEEKN